MKKINLITAISLSLVSIFVSNSLFANSYFPPERIQCQKDKTDNALRCYGFDSHYLAIGAVNDARAVPEKRAILSFIRGESASIIGPVRFSYQTGDGAMTVFLVNANPTVLPDFKNPSHWLTNGQQAYICHSYMTCPLTDL